MSEAWKQWEGRLVDGKFQLRQYLGGSDHSAVFLTERGEPAQRAAIKFIQVDAGAAELQLSRWRRAAKLSHPHLLQILDCGRCRITDFNLLYVVMERANENLADFLLQRPLTPAETREVLAPALQALGYLHSEGLAHGHIQPSNILAIDDQLKLSCDSVSPAPVAKPDEGKDLQAAPAGTINEQGQEASAAGAMGESATLRRPSPYCPPEAVKGTAVSATGDVWSLGVSLVEMLTQRPPAVGTAPRQDPALPETLPALFLEIARNCLKRDPRARWTVAQIAERVNPSVAPLAAAPVADATVRPATTRIIELLHPSATPPVSPPTDASSRAPVTLAGIPVAPSPGSSPAAPVAAAIPSAVADAGLAAAVPSAAKPVTVSAAATAPARIPPPVPSKSEPYHIPAPRPPMQGYGSGRSDVRHHDTGLPSLPKLKQPPLMPKMNYFILGVALGLLFIGFLGIKLFSRRTPVQQQAAAVAPQQSAAPEATKSAQPVGRSKSPAKSAAKAPATLKNAGAPPAQQAARTPAQNAVKSASDKQPVVAASTPQPSSPAPAPPPVSSPHTDTLAAAVVPAAGSSTASWVHGEVLNQVLPEVSDKARSTIWGTVRVAVKVHVDPTGNVTGAELNSPGPSRFFADKALEAAKDWDFVPAKLDGHNVASEWIIRFHFTQSDTKVYPAETTP